MSALGLAACSSPAQGASGGGGGSAGSAPSQHGTTAGRPTGAANVGAPGNACEVIPASAVAALLHASVADLNNDCDTVAGTDEYQEIKTSGAWANDGSGDGGYPQLQLTVTQGQDLPTGDIYQSETLTLPDGYSFPATTAASAGIGEIDVEVGDDDVSVSVTFTQGQVNQGALESVESRLNQFATVAVPALFPGQ